MAGFVTVKLYDLKGHLLQEKHLHVGEEWVIGSNPDVDWVLEPLEGVYPEHFRLSATGEGVILKNLSILGKVYLNEEQVEYRPLASDDVIRMGPYTFKIEGALTEEAQVEPLGVEGGPPSAGDKTPEGEEEAPVEYEAEMPTEAPPETPQPEGPEVEEETVIAQLTQARLIWFSPEGKRAFDLKGEEIVVGRAEYAQIHIDDPDMSREHFKIQEREGAYYLVDLNSANGTRANGVLVSETMLNDQDEIEAGQTIFQFSIGLREAIQPFEAEEEGTKVVEFIKPKEEKKPPPPKEPWYRNRRKLFIAMGVLAFLLLLVFLIEPEPEEVVVPEAAPPTVVEPKDPWDLLTPEQQEDIENSYADSQKLMARRAWEEAYVLLRKIQDYGVPYKNVDDLLRRAQQEIIAMEQRLYEEEQRSAERERGELIDQFLREGKLYLERSQFELAREMFANVLELDPLNDEAIRGMEAAQNKQEDIDYREKERLELEASERRVSDYYQQVVDRIEQNEFDDARLLIKRRLKIVPYTTDHWDFKFQEALALSNEKEQAFYNPQLEEARFYLGREEWRRAWEICHRLVERNPALEEATKCRKIADMRLQVRSRKLYQDAIVAESLGNITEAREKWAQILEIAPPYDLYYERAITKLDIYK